MMRFDRPQRVWINQPSGLQEYHALHGKRAIAVAEKYDAPEYDAPDCPFITVYFGGGGREYANRQAGVVSRGGRMCGFWRARLFFRECSGFGEWFCNTVM